jgi:hypothetical protein
MTPKVAWRLMTMCQARTGEVARRMQDMHNGDIVVIIRLGIWTWNEIGHGISLRLGLCKALGMITHFSNTPLDCFKSFSCRMEDLSNRFSSIH